MLTQYSVARLDLSASAWEILRGQKGHNKGASTARGSDCIYLIPRDRKKKQRAKCSVVEPYHVDTDPDPGSEKIRDRSGSTPNFETDPDPGENYGSGSRQKTD